MRRRLQSHKRKKDCLSKQRTHYGLENGSLDFIEKSESRPSVIFNLDRADSENSTRALKFYIFTNIFFLNQITYLMTMSLVYSITL